MNRKSGDVYFRMTIAHEDCDAGECIVSESWFVDINNDRYLDVVTREESFGVYIDGVDENGKGLMMRDCDDVKIQLFIFTKSSNSYTEAKDLSLLGDYYKQKNLSKIKFGCS